MGVCDSTISQMYHHSDAYVARVKVVPTVPVLLQSNAEDNIRHENNFSGHESKSQNSVLTVISIQEENSTEQKTREPAGNKNQLIDRDYVNIEDGSFWNKEWQPDQISISRDYDGFHEDRSSPKVREQSLKPSGFENYRRLSSAFFENEERKSQSGDQSLLSLPGLKNIAPEGFTKVTFREFVMNIPGSESHREVVLSEFEELWNMLAGGKDKIPLSRLYAFYNTEKSKEEHNREMEKVKCEIVNEISCPKLTNELNNVACSSKIGTSFGDVKKEVKTGVEQWGYNFTEQSDSEESVIDWQWYTKTKIARDTADGNQHQLALDELKQTQSDDDGCGATKRFSFDSSSTKSLSYPSTTAQEQIMSEYMKNDTNKEEINNTQSIRKFEVTVDAELNIRSSSFRDETVSNPEPLYTPSTPDDSRGLYQGRLVTQTQSKEFYDESLDDCRDRDPKSEIYQDFVFRSGPRVMKRRRVIQRSSSKRDRRDPGTGYWLDFEDLNRVSNPDQRIGWKQRRKWRLEAAKQLKKCRSLKVPSPILLDANRLKSICKEWNLSPSIGEDIVMTLNAGEKLSTVDLLNRYGEAASLESLKRFYMWSHTMVRNEKTTRPLE